MAARSTSSTKKLCDTEIPLHILTGMHLLSVIAWMICKLRESITRMNKRGDSRHPCRRPLSTLKKEEGMPFTITAY